MNGLSPLPHNKKQRATAWQDNNEIHYQQQPTSQQFQANSFVSPEASNSNKFKFQTAFTNQQQQYNTQYYSSNNFTSNQQQQQYQSTSLDSPINSNLNKFKFQTSPTNLQQQYKTQHNNKRNNDNIINDRIKRIRGNNLNEQFHLN